MFSSRIPWSLEPNPLSRLLAQRRASGMEILDLTESNPTRAGFEYPPDLLAALNQPAALRYEPSPLGLGPARQAVAELAAAPVQRVLLTASTSEAYSYLFKLLCDPGDQVLVPQPSYPLFEFLARLDAVEITPYPLVYGAAGWQVDLDALALRVSARTRAILAVHPNNPTGNYLSAAELDRFEQIAARSGAAIILDEVFSCYPMEDALTPAAPSGRALVFRLNGLSKLAGLPQLKAGWILVDGPEPRVNEALSRLELIADTYLSVSAPVMHALPRLIDSSPGVRRQILDRVRANYFWLKREARPLHADAGWYAILSFEEVDEESAVLDLLNQDGVLIQPGFFYDFPANGSFVLSLLTPPAVFQEGVSRLLRRFRYASVTSRPSFRDT